MLYGAVVNQRAASTKRILHGGDSRRRRAKRTPDAAGLDRQPVEGKGSRKCCSDVLMSSVTVQRTPNMFAHRRGNDGDGEPAPRGNIFVLILHTFPRSLCVCVQLSTRRSEADGEEINPRSCDREKPIMQDRMKDRKRDKAWWL